MQTDGKQSWTAYPEINTLLADVLAGVRAILGAQLAGFYLHGSLAGGEFKPGRSDIDFLVVTEGPLAPERLRQLAGLHAGLYASGRPWADHLEGSYIPRDEIRRYDPQRSTHPALRIDGSFDIDGHGSDWIIQRWILREKGIALAGPPLVGLIDPVSADDLRRAARGILLEWWAPQLEDTHRLLSREYQAYAALTMCRSLYTLACGQVAGKTTAARWAQAELGPAWQGLIAQALDWPDGEQPDRLADTLALIRATLERSAQADASPLE